MQTKYPYKQDDDLLCEAGDLIDNAVWAFVLSARKDQTPPSEDKALFAEAVQALKANPDQNVEIPDAMFEEAVRIARSPQIKKMLSFEKEEEPEWNMGVIGDVTDAIEGLMSDSGVETCHPWQDDEECICYCTEERCPYCRRGEPDPS